MTTLFEQTVQTPIGACVVICDAANIIRLILPNGNPSDEWKELGRKLGPVERRGENEATRACAAWLLGYFAGKREPLPVPCAPGGTPFQAAVWRALQTVPYGTAISYTRLGQMAGVAGARAVGNAVGANPIPIVIPCHRVLHADGGLGGFSGGLDVKVKLLAVEDIRFNEGRAASPKVLSR